MEKISNKDYLFTDKNLLRLLFPLMIEQLLAVAVGMADSLMVASVGESAVSAVSLVDSINILLINIFAALATGGAVVAGQYIGKNRSDKACEAGEQLIVFVTLISLVVMAIMYFGRGFILNVLFGGIEQDVAAYSNTYMLIVFASIPFIAIYNCGAALFRSMGNSKVTMMTSLIMNGINVAGNALLVYGFRMGVAGVAIPTLVSRAVAAVIIISLLRNQELIIRISRPFRYKYNKEMVKNYLLFYVDFVMGHPYDFIKILYNNNNTLFTEEGRAMQTLLDPIIEEGFKNKELTVNMKVSEINEYLYQAMRGLIFHWCLHNGDFDLHQRAEKYLDLLISPL